MKFRIMVAVRIHPSFGSLKNMKLILSNPTLKDEGEITFCVIVRVPSCIPGKVYKCITALNR
jgi:hypothetical protein